MKRLFTILLAIVALVACDKPTPEPVDPQPKPEPEPVVLPQDIVPNITQLDYQHTSADDVLRIECVEESFSGAILPMYLIIEPKEIINKITEYHTDMVTLNILLEGSDTPIVIASAPGKAEEWQGWLYVEFACDNLPMELYRGDVGATGNVTISDGVNKLSTESFSIGVNTPVPMSNQLWYFTSDGQPIEFKSNDGPAVVSVDHPIYEKYVVTFAENLTHIPSAYFNSKSNVTKIILPNSVQSFANDAFQWCYDLHTINIPSGITQLSEQMFSVTKLRNIYIDDLAAWCNITFNGPILEGLEENTTKSALYVQGERVSEITIPESVNKIPRYAFMFDNLRCIHLHNGVTKIGACAFDHAGLEEFTMPNSVTEIEGNLFNACRELKSVTLSSGLVNIPMYTFNECISLTEIVIPEGIKTISLAAFYRCLSLVDITLPDSVEQIEDQMFTGCESLQSVTFGSGIVSIGDAPFLKCSKMNKITLKATTPPSLKIDLFRDSQHDVPADLEIYVPAESVEAYKSSESWAKYADYIMAF